MSLSSGRTAELPGTMIGLFRSRTMCEIELGVARARVGDPRMRLECREELVQ